MTAGIPEYVEIRADLIGRNASQYAELHLRADQLSRLDAFSG